MNDNPTQNPNTAEALLKVLEQAQQEKRNLEQQRLATLNVLEDVHKAQEELARKYDYIKNIRDLLEKLTVSNDFLSVIEAAFSCFQKTVESSYIAFFYNGIVYVFSDNKLPFDYQEKLKSAFLNLIEVLGLEKKDLQFRVIKEGTEENKKKGSDRPISFPVVMKGQKTEKDKVLGLIYINRIIEDNGQTGDQSESIDDILNLIAINLERIQALDASEHSKFNDLIQSMTDGILMFDVDKKVVITNPFLQRTAGLTSLSTLENFTKLFEGVDLGSKIDEVFEKESPISLKEVKFMNFDYEVLITPVRDYKRNITGGAIILHDITRLKEIDRMKTDFLSVAAHQLRTPLGGIRWSLGSLIDGDLGKLPDKVEASLKRVQEAILRMVNLVNDLLNVSKIDQGKFKGQPKIINVIDEINNLINETKEIASSKSVTVQLIASENEKFEVFMDPDNFKMAMENFLSNAITYNKQGGSVDILVSKEDSSIKIAVKDTGIGIPSKDQIKIFAKFFRAGNAVSMKTDGSGLGLFVAKSYIDNWGGRVEFTSEEGRGTTFVITLPVAENSQN